MAAGKRLEIQALRAAAVVLVVLYHSWPEAVTGGFVGVDVFFVISGFLITGHLAREMRAGGISHIPLFWARRLRRLLPAALLVLVTTAVVVITIAPRALWQQFLSEVIASTVYVQNWALVFNSVDYLAMGNDESPTQHFWSLSVEEQFYVFWPFLVLLAVGVAGTYKRRSVGLILALGVVSMASLIFSVFYSAYAPSPAYFSTFTRAWEFGAGGLLAMIAPSGASGRHALRSAVSWVGLAALGVAAVGFTDGISFPGYAALLPVAGTLAVIWAGIPISAFSPGKAMSWKPTQVIGDLSYSIYLWHWPLLVLTPFFWGPLGAATKLMLLFAAVALAALSKRFVEDPVRRAPFLTERKSGWTFLGSAAAMLVVIGVAVGGYQNVSAHILAAEAAAQSERDEACFGAGAMVPVNACDNPYEVTATANLAHASTDLGVGVTTGPCELGGSAIPIPPCEFGKLGSDRTIVLFGDSHAGQLIEPLDIVGAHQGWKLLTYIQGGCPGIGVLDDGECKTWGDTVLDRIIRDPAVHGVIVSNATSRYALNSGALDANEFAKDLIALTSAGKEVVLVRDPPGSYRGDEDAEAINIHDCLKTNTALSDPCAIDRSLVVTNDVLVRAAGLAAVPLVDLSDAFCDEKLCHSVIGGLFVYADGSHLTRSYARTLAPYFEAELSGYVW